MICTLYQSESFKNVKGDVGRKMIYIYMNFDNEKAWSCYNVFSFVDRFFCHFLLFLLAYSIYIFWLPLWYLKLSLSYIYIYIYQKIAIIFMLCWFFFFLFFSEKLNYANVVCRKYSPSVYHFKTLTNTTSKAGKSDRTNNRDIWKFVLFL